MALAEHLHDRAGKGFHDFDARLRRLAGFGALLCARCETPHRLLYRPELTATAVRPPFLWWQQPLASWRPRCCFGLCR